MSVYTYNTNGDPEQKESKLVNQSKTIETHFPAEDIPLGFNMINIEYMANYCITSSIDGIKPVDETYQAFEATVHLDACGPNILRGAGCTWLDVSKWDEQFQFGRERLTEDMRERGQETIDIKFDKPFEVVPKIVVWMCGLNVASGNGAHTYATDVTTTGFKLWMSGLGNHVRRPVRGCRVSWVAVPQDWPNVTAGTFEFSDDGAHLLEHKTDIEFEKPFQRAPRVLVALNKIYMNDGPRASHLEVEAKAENVTSKGMMLSIKSWNDCYIEQGGVDYIAIVD